MRPSISEIRSTGQISHSYDWNFYVTKFPNVVSGFTSGEMNIRVESTDQPNMIGETVELNLRGHKVNYPGRYTPNGIITLTLIEYADSRVSEFIKAWSEVCWAPNTGLQQIKSDVEAELKLERLSVAGEKIWAYKLHGCFLETYEAGGQLDGTTSDPLRPVMTIRFDWFEQGKNI